MFYDVFMKKVRLTRQQSQAQTQQRLLDAAQALFVKKGFGATSVEHITLAAGYSRGAFYSNFKSKTQLFIELLTRDHQRILAGLQTILDNPDTPDHPVSHRVAAELVGTHDQPALAVDGNRSPIETQLIHYYSRIYRDTQFYTLWLEARLHASRDANFCTQFNAFQQDILATITQYVYKFAARTGLTLPLPAEQLALGFMALGDGMGMYHLPGQSHADDLHAEQILAYFLERIALQR